MKISKVIIFLMIFLLQSQAVLSSMELCDIVSQGGDYQQLNTSVIDTLDADVDDLESPDEQNIGCCQCCELCQCSSITFAVGAEPIPAVMAAVPFLLQRETAHHIAPKVHSLFRPPIA
jgi:hypothetical protein